MRILKVDPMGKPRMTRRDKWATRPGVSKYRSLADEIRACGLTDYPECNGHLVLVLPMPKSWSLSKKRTHFAQPHQAKPDKDNLEKAILDAIFSKRNKKAQSDDAHIWHGLVSKFWGYEGMIILGELEEEIPARAEKCHEFIESLLYDLQGEDTATRREQ